MLEASLREQHLLPDDIEQDELDDIEPVGDENQLYEHFRVVVDKGQAMVRVDKYLFERIVNASRNHIQRFHFIAALHRFAIGHDKTVFSRFLYAIARSIDDAFKQIFIDPDHCLTILNRTNWMI